MFLGVLGEGVVAEVLLQVAPGGVDVVSTALKVGHLEQEGWALDAVVVRLADFEAAVPGEHEGVLHGVDRRELAGGEVRAGAANVFEDDLSEHLLLFGGEGRGGDALVLDESVGLLLVASHDVLVGILAKEALLALFGGEGLGELASEVVFVAQELEAHESGLAFLDLARVAGEEGGRRADELAVNQREVEREVVAFPAEAPSALGVRRTEDRHEVVLGVTLRARALFDFQEQLFEGHDLLSLHVATTAEGNGEDGLGEVALAGIHFLERQALAGGRHEDPVSALSVVEAKGRLGLLVSLQGAEEGRGCGRHFFTGGMAERGGDGGGQEAQHAEETGKETHGGVR